MQAVHRIALHDFQHRLQLQAEILFQMWCQKQRLLSFDGYLRAPGFLHFFAQRRRCAVPHEPVDLPDVHLDLIFTAGIQAFLEEIALVPSRAQTGMLGQHRAGIISHIGPEQIREDCIEAVFRQDPHSLVPAPVGYSVGRMQPGSAQLAIPGGTGQGESQPGLPVRLAGQTVSRWIQFGGESRLGFLLHFLCAAQSLFSPVAAVTAVVAAELGQVVQALQPGDIDCLLQALLAETLPDCGQPVSDKSQQELLRRSIVLAEIHMGHIEAILIGDNARAPAVLAVLTAERCQDCGRLRAVAVQHRFQQIV